MAISDEWRKLVKKYETRNQYSDLLKIADKEFTELADALVGPIWEGTADGRKWHDNEFYHNNCDFCRNMTAESVKILLHRINKKEVCETK